MFFEKLYLTLVAGVWVALTACAGSPAVPAVEPASLTGPTIVPTHVPVPESRQVTPTASPTFIPTVALPTSTPTPKPSLEDILLADARHIQGAADAPVTFIEFSDFK